MDSYQTGDLILLATSVFAVLLFGCGYVILFKTVGQTKTKAVIILGNLLGTLALSCGLFLGLELYFRFWYDSTDSFGLARVNEKWIERHYHSNSSGYRDNVDYSLSFPRHLRRLTFLGDSLTVGQGVRRVEDRFLNRIRRSKQQQWQVHGLALYGLDTGDQLEILANHLAAGYKLDTVVLVYCLNDISDLLDHWKEVVSRLRQRNESRGFLVRHSFFADFLHCRIVSGQDKDIADYCHFVVNAYEGDVWDQQQERLRVLKNLCRANGGKLVVVTFPFLHAIQGEYEYGHIHTILARFWASEQVAHLDLLPVFRKQRSESLVVSRFDAHPNERAHELASAAIADFLAQHVEPQSGK